MNLRVGWGALTLLLMLLQHTSFINIKYKQKITYESNSGVGGLNPDTFATTIYITDKRNNK